MLKRQSKVLSIALIFVFCMSFMLAGFVAPQVASASSTVTPTGQVAQVTPGDTFGATVLVTVSEYAFTGAGPYDFRLALPAGYKLTNGVTDIAFGASGEQKDNSIDITTTPGVPAVTAALVAGTNNIFTISVNAWTPGFVGPPAIPATLQKKGQFTITLNNINVPAGASTDVKVSIDAAPGSPFSSQEVTIANVGVGKVSVAMGDVNIITSANTAATNVVDVIKIKEDRSGALEPGANSLTLKLPVGMTWDIAGAAITPVWGTATAGINLTDADRTLNIRNTGAGTTSYWEIRGACVMIDESVAKPGDVVAMVAGRTASTVNDVTVAKYGEFDVKVVDLEDAKQVVAGKWGQRIGSFAIEEGIGGSLVAQRTITLELSGNQIWQLPVNPADGTDPLVMYNAAGALTYAPPALDRTKSKNIPTFAAGVAGTIWTPVGTSGKIIKATVTSTNLPNDPAYLVFHNAEVVVAPTSAREGTIKVLVDGTAGAKGEAVVANVIPPVTGKSNDINELRIGVQGQKIAPMVITETIKEGIDSRVIGVTGLNRLNLVFPQGVVPSVSTLTAKVLEGNMQINAKAAGVQKLADGRWFVDIPVLSTSMTPAKIEIDNLTVSLDRTVAEGDVTVAITGSAVNQTTHQRWFPGDLAVGSFVCGKAITPAPAEITGNGEFKISSNIYKVNGVAKVMDAAPYIKAGRTYVPMRYLGEILGAEVLWDDSARTVTLTRGDDVVVFTIGSATYTVNGESKTAEVAPEINNGRTMLPARFVAEAFGAQVGWDAGTQTVLIQK